MTGIIQVPKMQVKRCPDNHVAGVGLYSPRLESDKGINPISMDEAWLRRTTNKKTAGS
jgi:hypothetical protein